MKIRRFDGSTVREALQRIRKEWGTNALILKTQRIRRGFAVTAALPSREDREREIDLPWSPARSSEEEGVERLFERVGIPLRLVAELRRTLQKEGRPGAGGLGLEAEMLAELTARLPIYPRRGVHGGEGARVLAFIGPTGVGKTTTLAKLAGRLVHEAGIRPALITLDTYRVAAVDQLRAYAKLLSTPFEVAASPEDLVRILGSLRESRVILIDTSGRSPFDAEHLRELQGALAGRSDLEPLLCLAATTAPDLLDETVERFRIARPRACIFTKIDEATRLGPLVAMAIERHLPVAYLTDGQEVPRDLHPADAAGIMRRVLHGTLSAEVRA